MQEYMEMFQRVQLKDQIMFEILAEMSVEFQIKNTEFGEAIR